MDAMKALLLTPCYIAFLPIVVALWLAHRNDLISLRKTANEFRCVSCGMILGMKSLELAETECMRHMEELRRQNPGVKFRMIRNLHAICANCGTMFSFVKKDRTFVVTGERNEGDR